MSTGLPLYTERGGACNDKEIWTLREGCDDILAHPVGEELLLGVVAHVHEREYGNRWFVR